jgi:hypothetical protein
VKVKKATKRLSRVEALLSGVLNGYATDITEVREPLEAATAAVKRARSAIDSNQSSGNQRATSSSGRTASSPDSRTGEGGKRTRPAANNRVGTAKRKRTATAYATSHGKSSQQRKAVRAKGPKRIAEAVNRRTANQKAARNAPTTGAQRKSSARKETVPAGGPTATEVAANGVSTQTATSV